MQKNKEIQEVSKPRLIAGGIIFIGGFASPALIPLITSSNLSLTLKTSISGLLAFGIPEIAMVIAIAILGKDGYALLKQKLSKLSKPFLPPENVSKTRYRIGLILFCSPIIYTWLSPYILNILEIDFEMPIWLLVSLDICFVFSFFVLGGNFWEKVRSLFHHTPQYKHDINNPSQE